MSSYPQPGDLTEQQQPVFNFSSALPFKKRRFPVIRPPSPPPEETISSPIKNASKNEQESKISENNELKSQQELKIQDGENPSSIDARNASSPGNADMNKASVSAVEKDVSTSNTDLGTPNTENVQSKLQDEKPTVNLKSVADLGNSKFDILSNENSPEFDVPKSCARSQIEGTCGVESSMGPMSVELSLGGKELAVPFTEHEKDEDICNKPDKSDPSLLSMALSDKELARLEKIDSTLNEVASQAITNRSNWDLNTTMDVWEGSLGTNALTDTPAGIFGSRKNDDIQDEKFSLITAGKIDFSLDKGKKILDVSGSNTDDSLGLRLATPHMEPDVRKEHFSLSDSSFATSSTSCLGLQSVQTSASPVKSEPVDENTKRDCNMGNGSNSNVVGLLKLSSVKTELVDNHRVETVLQQSVSPEKLIYSGESVKSEAIHQHNQTACKSDDIGNLSAVDHEDTFELDDDEKLNGPAETTEVGVLIDKGENKRRKEDEEYEDGEVREPIQCPGAEKPVGVEKEMENSEYFMHASRNSQPTGDQDIISPSKFNPPKDSAKKILEETRNDLNGDSLSPYGEINCLQKASEEVLEGGVDEKRAISVNPDELLQNCPAKEISVYKLADVDCGVSIELEDADNNNSTLSKSETSLDGHDCVKDSSNLGNKSRIINLSRASAVTSPSKTESVTKTLLTTQSGKERYSGFDGQAQQWGNNREEFYTASRTNRFVNDRAHDQDRPHRNLRSSFSNRRRISGRFDSRVDWDSSDHDFASEILYSPSDYRPTRRQLTSDLDTECNGYEIQQDGPSDRRKSKKDEFPSLRRDRENHQIFSLFRNSSPNRQRDKFMRHLSDEIINNPSSYNNPQAIYDELDDGQQQQQQLVRGNRNFSNMQRRKGYSRNNRSKSPARDTPGFYRSGRMRSPDRTRFRDEMVPRRRGSPSYGPRHHPSNDLRRGSPERDFSRSGRRRNEGFDNSREMMGDCDEYMNGPGNSKFNERRGPVRSFRPGFNGDSENLNFRFNLDEGHRPYRFCSDSDGEFGERGNGRMREREFDRRVKQHHNQSLGVSRRIRNVEDHEDGNYRTVERAWHDNDGFSDGREKRRRF